MLAQTVTRADPVTREVPVTRAYSVCGTWIRPQWGTLHPTVGTLVQQQTPGL